MDLDQATAALGALLEQLTTSQKATLDDEADQDLFREALTVVVEDARKADLDAARNVSMGIGRESIQWALQLATDRLVDRDGVVSKASVADELDGSLRRVGQALDWADKAARLVQVRPDAAHYRHDLERANAAVKAATGELRTAIEEAEAVIDDQWVDRWITHGQKRAEKIKSAVYIGRLQSMGYWG